jgi:hypothetical protein
VRLQWPLFDVLFLDQRTKVKESIGRVITTNVRFWGSLKYGICELESLSKHRFMAELKKIKLYGTAV